MQFSKPPSAQVFLPLLSCTVLLPEPEKIQKVFRKAHVYLLPVLISHNHNAYSEVKRYKPHYSYHTTYPSCELLLVYCTFPKKMVVAKVNIKGILCDTPNNLWERTKEYSGVSKKFFDKYFKDREIAYAYELGKILEYKNPRPLKDFGIEFAPQSFVYVGI